MEPPLRENQENNFCGAVPEGNTETGSRVRFNNENNGTPTMEPSRYEIEAFLIVTSSPTKNEAIVSAERPYRKYDKSELSARKSSFCVGDPTCSVRVYRSPMVFAVCPTTPS